MDENKEIMIENVDEETPVKESEKEEVRTRRHSIG